MEFKSMKIGSMTNSFDLVPSDHKTGYCQDRLAGWGDETIKLPIDKTNWPSDSIVRLQMFATGTASVDKSFTLLGGGRAGYKGDYNSRGWQEFYFSSIWSRLHKEEKRGRGTKGDSLEPRWICLPAEEHMTQLGSRTRFQSILIDLTKVALDHDLTLSSCQQYTNKRSQNRVKL